MRARAGVEAIKDEIQVFLKLRKSGYTVTEAHQILRYLQEERWSPSSRTKATRLRKAEEALRGIGIDPATITF